MRFRVILGLAAMAVLGSCSGNEKKQEQMASLTKTTDDPKADLARLTKALENEPGNAALLAQRGKLQLTLKNPAAALSDFEKALSNDSTKPEYLFLKAKAQRAFNRIEPALQTLNSAEAKGHRQPELYVLKGEILMILKQYQDAINNFNQALKIQPFNEAAYFYKGLVYAETGDTVRALSGLQTSIEQATDFVDGYAELAKIHTAQKKYAEAEQYIQSGLRFAPTNPFLHYNRGVNLVNQHYPDSAAVSFKEALRYDPTLFMAAYNLGVIEYNAKRYKTAVPYFEQALPHAEKLPLLRLLLADSYELTGNLTEAEKQYNLVLQQTPGNKLALDGLNRLKSAPNQVKN